MQSLIRHFVANFVDATAATSDVTLMC